MTLFPAIYIAMQTDQNEQDYVWEMSCCLVIDDTLSLRFDTIPSDTVQNVAFPW